MYPKHDSEFITNFSEKTKREKFYHISFPNAPMSCVNSISLKFVGRSDNAYCMKDL